MTDLMREMLRTLSGWIVTDDEVYRLVNNRPQIQVDVCSLPNNTGSIHVVIGTGASFTILDGKSTALMVKAYAENSPVAMAWMREIAAHRIGQARQQVKNRLQYEIDLAKRQITKLEGEVLKQSEIISTAARMLEDLR